MPIANLDSRAVRTGLRSGLVVGLLLAAQVAWSDPPETPPGSPAEVIEQIRTRNPDLAAITANIEAAHHVGPRVSSLPDPMFSVGLSNFPLSSDQTPLTGVQFELRQTIPWLGKLSAREEVAGHDVAIGAAMLEDRRNALVARGQALLWELTYLAERRRLALEIKQTLEQFARVAEAIYTSGSGRQQDLIKPVVAQHRIDDQVVGIDRQVEIIKSEINALRARPVEAPVQAPRLADAAALPSRADLAALVERARRDNPHLQMQRQRVSKQQAALGLAEQEAYPDFSVGLQYRLRWVESMDAVNGADFIGVGLGISLPVYYGSKQGERREEVRARIRAADASLRSAVNTIQDRISQTVEAIERDREQAALYREKIIPDTDKTLQASLTDYRTGNLEFLSVLDNLMDLFRAKVDLVRRTTRIQASRARLIYLIGGPIPTAWATNPAQDHAEDRDDR